MFFFKSKQKSDELLPPPPPFPGMGLEEDAEFSEAEPEKEAGIEFEGLLDDSKGLSKAKKKAKAAKQKPKAALAKKLPVKAVNEKKALIRGRQLPKKAKGSLEREFPAKDKIPKAKFPVLEQDFGLEEDELAKEFGLPEDALQDYGIEDIEKELGIEKAAGKPKEVLEAEEEITSAIDRMRNWDGDETAGSKSNGKFSFFKRLFARKAVPKDDLFPDIATVEYDVSTINKSLGKAREALAKLDLETARRLYFEIIKAYNMLSPQEQAKVYHEIRELYSERKSAEELKV